MISGSEANTTYPQVGELILPPFFFLLPEFQIFLTFDEK